MNTEVGIHADKNLRATYGITMEQKEKMAFEQDCKCAACGLEAESLSDLCVDHDRCSGRIRGLLCNKCNLALGSVDDDVEKLRGLLRYLTRHSDYLYECP